MSPSHQGRALQGRRDAAVPFPRFSSHADLASCTLSKQEHCGATRQTTAQHTEAAGERSMHRARSTAHLVRLAAHSAPSRAGAVRGERTRSAAERSAWTVVACSGPSRRGPRPRLPAGEPLRRPTYRASARRPAPPSLLRGAQNLFLARLYRMMYMIVLRVRTAYLVHVLRGFSIQMEDNAHCALTCVALNM